MHFGRSCCIRHQATLRTKEIKTSDWLLQGIESKKKKNETVIRVEPHWVLYVEEKKKGNALLQRLQTNPGSRVNIINSVRITYRSYRSSARPSAHHRLSEACVKLSLDLLHLSSSSSFTLMLQSQLSLMNNSFCSVLLGATFFFYFCTQATMNS